MKREPIYVDDFHSVPSSWVDVSDKSSAWDRNEVAVRKDSQIFLVSQEFLDDYGPEGIFGLLRPQTWKQRADATLHTYRLSYRVRQWWSGVRERLSDRIYPERERDY